MLFLIYFIMYISYNSNHHLNTTILFPETCNDSLYSPFSSALPHLLCQHSCCLAAQHFDPNRWLSLNLGVRDMVSPVNGTTGSINFWYGFTTVPRAGLCIKSMTETTPTGRVSIRISGVTATLSAVSWMFTNETTGSFSVIEIGYMAIDQTITYVTYFEFQVLESNYAPYPTTQNSSHNLSIIGYLTGFSLDSILLLPLVAGGGVKDLSIAVSLWNTTHCRVVLAQNNQTYLVSKSPSVGTVLIDSTVSATFKQHYFDINTAFTATGNINATLATVTSFQVSTLFVGLNGFVFAAA